MDQFKRSYYELMFENLYLKKKGSAFQDFFSEMMAKCHPGDFQRVRPWGNAGDRKNDGDEIVATFKSEYENYRRLGVNPDIIFCKLQEFTMNFLKSPAF